MARIKFLSDQVYDTGAPNKGPTFKAGQVVDETKIAKLLGMRVADEEFRSAWMRRWVNRGVAEFVNEDEAEVAAVPAASAQTEPPAPGGQTEPSKPAGQQATQQAAGKA